MAPRIFIVAVLVLACSDERGQVGKFCRPDGTCISDKLECAAAEQFLGMQWHEPTCQPKRRSNMAPRKPLDVHTLRYVARRMRRYHRHYDAAEHPRNVDAAFAAGVARMAKKAADECTGTADAIEARTQTPAKKRKRA